VSPPVLPTATSSKCVVDVSETGGLGVFVSPGQTVEAGEVLTSYPGQPRWASVDDYTKFVRDNPFYGYTLGPFRLHTSRHYIIWDASPFARNWSEDAIGHLLNSSHPALNEPWAHPTAHFGLHFNNFIADTSVSPNVVLCILANERIVGYDANDHRRHEVLLDYHWQITSVFGYHCRDMRCVNCCECLRIFSVSWASHMRRLEHVGKRKNSLNV
jgi:hypothetical protein